MIIKSFIDRLISCKICLICRIERPGMAYYQFLLTLVQSWLFGVILASQNRMNEKKFAGTLIIVSHVLSFFL